MAISTAQGSGPIFLDNLACSGEESELLECDRISSLGLGLYSELCDHSNDVGVLCEGEGSSV